MKISTLSIFVDDQRKALAFYTDVLGFVPKDDIPLGEYSWLTVTAPDAPHGTQILLEPADHPAVGPFRSALVADGIPWTQFEVSDIQAEHERLTDRGVVFTQPPSDLGPVTTAVFDDTVGNLIQLVQPNATSPL
jgi:catechol 2,3-dioxygenase-like lactoylglutathione lyase family enzyme